MKKTIKIIVIVLGVLLLGFSWLAWYLYDEIQRARSEDPLVWEESVSALEAKTGNLYVPGQAVVFVGSSSIRLWRTLEKDMAPLSVVRHGFGGAKFNAVVHYAERLVSAYQPRAVVVFAGTNDIDPAASKAPEVLLASYQAFVDKVRDKQPGLPIFYIGITPSPRRWTVWPIAQTANRLIEDWARADPNQHFIDTSPALLGSNGEPNPDNYFFDGLHLSKRGYSIWREIIRQRLLDDLGEF